MVLQQFHFQAPGHNNCHIINSKLKLLKKWRPETSKKTGRNRKAKLVGNQNHKK
jgi:hypothetical protein